MLQIFVYSPVKVKCRRTNCPGSFGKLSGFRLQVSFDNVEIVCGFVPGNCTHTNSCVWNGFSPLKHALIIANISTTNEA